jgi:hypothetical protein
MIYIRVINMKYKYAVVGQILVRLNALKPNDSRRV